MKVTIAIDSFKGSLSTFEAGNAAAEGIKRVYPDAQTVVSPIADGGEGTAQAVVSALGGRMINVRVSDPLGRDIVAQYGYIEETATAVMEMSCAAGITLVSETERDPMNTTTFGVGQMILDAIKNGCRKFVVGIGGSATNDGGVGMLCALGYEFLDSNGNVVPMGARGLKELCEIRNNKVIPELSECSFRIACDVTNPLCGDTAVVQYTARRRVQQRKIYRLWTNGSETMRALQKNFSLMPMRSIPVSVRRAVWDLHLRNTFRESLFRESVLLCRRQDSRSI